MEKTRNSKVIKILGVVVASILALIAVLTFANSQIDSVDKRLSANIADVARIERDHYRQIMDKLMEQGRDIGEIKGSLGRIEKKFE